MNHRDDDSAAAPTGSATAAASPASDRRLKRALRSASMAPEAAAEVDALQARVLAQWHGAHGSARTAPALAGGRPDEAATASFTASPALLAAQRRRRRVWVGTAGLTAAAALAMAVVVVSRPDPALDELMQPDVLSQLAIGEM